LVDNYHYPSSTSSLRTSVGKAAPGAEALVDLDQFVAAIESKQD
jgi:hypothetical protein